jgi:D-3-phosphoglycerate dehydrogenase
MKEFTVIRVDQNGATVAMKEEKEELSLEQVLLKGANCSTEEEIIAAAKEADVITTDLAVISRRVLESLPKCVAVIRYGVGCDTVDIQAASENKILVVNVPDFCMQEVSNHVFLLLLALCKKLVPLNNLVKAGRWAEAKATLAPMGSIHGQTLGIIGCGRIGQTVAQKAGCFGLNILGYDKYLPKSVGEKAGITLVEMDELLEKSDYITIHAPLSAETRHLIGENEIKKMKSSAFLINTSRGALIDEAALVAALQKKQIAGAGLDVYENEPVPSDAPLLKLDNVITLPHSGSYSDEAFSLLRRSVGKEAARIARGEMPLNVVNKTVMPKIPLKRVSA